MKNILKTITLILFLCSFRQYINAQNIILLKDRQYDTSTIQGFPVAHGSEIFQARIIDGYIYTIERWLPIFSNSSNTGTYYAKYDLNGNLIVRKRFPMPFKLEENGNYTHLDISNVTIFKDDQSNLVCYMPYIDTARNNLLYKFTSSLDSVKFTMIADTVINSTYEATVIERQCLKTSDGNYLLLSSFRDSRNFLYGHLNYKLQKIDHNLNVLWTKYVNNDTSTFFNPVSNNFQNYYKLASFDEIDGKFYFGLVVSDNHCTQYPPYGNPLDTACGKTRSIIAFCLLGFNQNGTQVSADTFNLIPANNIALFNTRIACNLYKTNTGLNVSIALGHYIGLDTFAIFNFRFYDKNG